ncbi:MAG: twin-arginine translocation signal domain-containing protein [Solirubrobacterales bacterium]|nr:twin-arginine translocation signal domain-containing protein [Solirubrobacterales bacterium]MBV9050074.1 twin-arginine translocation signal domain-containing protein [Solirubrobacterales bacterium]
MSELTRRGFVKTSAGAAAGVGVLGALAADQAEAHEGGRSGPVVAYVKDARRGEVSVMSGDREVTVRDSGLAARIVRAAR